MNSKLLPLSPSLYSKLPWALGLALLIALVVVSFSPQAADSALLRGDFPAFYSLGSIVLSADYSELYNIKLQAQIQNQHWPSLNGAQLVASYPPALAVLMAPFGLLPPIISKFFFSILSLSAIWLSLRLLRPSIGAASGCTGLGFVLLLLFPPLLMAVLGGQITALLIFVFSLCAVLSQKMSDASFTLQRNFLLGLLTSLSLLKPQFALVPLLYLLFNPVSAGMLGFFCGALLQYAFGAILLGFDWPFSWLEHLSFFVRQNNQLNLFQQTSLFAVADYFLGGSALFSPQRLCSYGLIIGLALLLLYVVVARGKQFADEAKESEQASTQAALFFALSLLPLFSPQSSFYDLSIGYFFLLWLPQPKSLGPPRLLVLGMLNYIILGLLVVYREPISSITSFPVFCLPAMLYAILAIWCCQNIRGHPR